jgi:hypothetical protein
MIGERKAPMLRIYIAQHCPTCSEAIRLADEVRRRFVKIDLQVINLDAEGSQNLDDVFSVPTYVLDGQILSLGNPDPDELFSRLTKELSRNGSVCIEKFCRRNRTRS